MAPDVPQIVDPERVRELYNAQGVDSNVEELLEGIAVSQSRPPEEVISIRSLHDSVSNWAAPNVPTWFYIARIQHPEVGEVFILCRGDLAGVLMNRYTRLGLHMQDGISHNKSGMPIDSQGIAAGEEGFRLDEVMAACEEHIRRRVIDQLPVLIPGATAELE